MVAATTGLSSPEEPTPQPPPCREGENSDSPSLQGGGWGVGRFANTIPIIAPAALSSTTRLMRLSPAISTTEYIIITSRVPTYGCTCPLASVLTISFGTPTGSARIAAVPMVVPAEPPRLSTPESFPSL